MPSASGISPSRSAGPLPSATCARVDSLLLRTCGSCPYGPKPHTVFEPALLIAVREGRQLKALQRNFLEPRTARCTRKVTLGHPGHGAWQGRPAGTRLAIAEGFETAESFALLHDLPCWASLGARRLDQILLPERLTELVLACDRDAEGLRAAARAEGRYARDRLVIHHAPPPPPFKDWAQVLDAQLKREGASQGRYR